jgi:hypothetical protein
MKLATVSIFTAAVLGSSVALSGSSTAHEQHPQPVHSARLGNAR